MIGRQHSVWHLWLHATWWLFLPLLSLACGSAQPMDSPSFDAGIDVAEADSGALTDIVDANDALPSDSGAEIAPDRIAAPPSFDPIEGRYKCDIDTCDVVALPWKVTLSSTTPGAIIHFTVDGTEPTMASATYKEPLALRIGTQSLVRAFTAAPGYRKSLVVDSGYDIWCERIPTEVHFIPWGGLSRDNDFVALLSMDLHLCGGICYAFDLVYPACDTAALRCTGGAQTYSSTMGVPVGWFSTEGPNHQVLLRAKGCARADLPESDFFWTLTAATPYVTLSTTVLSSTLPVVVPYGAELTLNTTTHGSEPPYPQPARIHYTIDGSPVTCSTSNPIVSDPASGYRTLGTVSPFTRNTTLNAIGCKTGYNDSEIRSQAIAVSLPAPAFQPAAATYTGTVSVRLNRAPQGEAGLPASEIACWSLNGDTPRCASDGASCAVGMRYVLADASPPVGPPITVSTTATLRAVACSANNAPSDVTVGAYTLP